MRLHPSSSLQPLTTPSRHLKKTYAMTTKAEKYMRSHAAAASYAARAEVGRHPRTASRALTSQIEQRTLLG
jgi:hypothetical protein